MLTFHLLNVCDDKTQPRQFKFTFKLQHEDCWTLSSFNKIVDTFQSLENVKTERYLQFYYMYLSCVTLTGIHSVPFNSHGLTISLPDCLSHFAVSRMLWFFTHIYSI